MHIFHFDSDINEEKDEFLTKQGIIKILNIIRFFNAIYRNKTTLINQSHANYRMERGEICSN